MACGLLIACFATAPGFADPLATGKGDWRFFLQAWETAQISMYDHGELPAWNPYQCGGMSLSHDPQAQYLSPLYLVLSWLPTALATKIFLWLHLLAGALGMMFLVRRRGRTPVASMAAGALWTLCGFFGSHLGGGHLPFVGFLLAPMIWLCFIRSLDDLRWTFATAGLMALIIYEGGVYPFPFLCLLLGFAALVETPARKLRPHLILGLTVAVALALSAARLLPILETSARFGRAVTEIDYLTPGELLDTLVHMKPSHAGGHVYAWQAEYHAFIGWPAFVIALLGGWFAARRRAGWIVLGALVFGSLALGSIHPLAPWNLLASLPIFESLRVPSRYLVWVSFFLCLLVAAAIDELPRLRLLRRARWPWVKVAVTVLLVLAAVGPAAGRTYRLMDLWERSPVPPVHADRGFIQLPRSMLDPLYDRLPRMNMGTVGCYTGVTGLKPARELWFTEEEQVRTEHGRAAIVGRTPNRLAVLVASEEATVLTFNQTWDPDWQASAGTVDEDEHGRLVVGLPAMEGILHLRYAPEAPREGLIWTLVALLLSCLALGLMTRRQPTKTKPRKGEEPLETALRLVRSADIVLPLEGAVPATLLLRQALQVAAEDAHPEFASQVERATTALAAVDSDASLRVQIKHAHELLEAEHAPNRGRSRLFWLVVAGVMTAIVAVVLMLTAQKGPGVAVDATSQHTRYRPHLALDGVYQTGWLLPNRELGHLQIGFAEALALGRVEVRNGLNPPYNDRGTNAFRLEGLSADGSVVWHLSGALPREEEWFEIDVPRKPVTGLRWVVESFYGLGGGLAEIRWAAAE